MSWREKIIEAHRAVTGSVSHSERLKSERYFVWQEDGENVLYAGNRLAERSISGTTDLYTKVEFDPWKEELEAALTAAGIAWYLNSIQYEEETGFYHYEWVWEVLQDGEDPLPGHENL